MRNMVRQQVALKEHHGKLSTHIPDGVFFLWCGRRTLQALIMTFTCVPLHSGIRGLTAARADEDAPASAAASYDVDGSGMVAPADVLALIDGIRESGGVSPQFDLDSSGIADEQDVTVLIDALLAGARLDGARTKRPIGPPGSDALRGGPNVIVTLSPPGVGPYPAGSQFPIGVSIQRALPGPSILLRLIQFDLEATDSLLTVVLTISHSDSTAGPFFFWDFASTAFCNADPSGCGSGYVDFLSGPRFTAVWIGFSADPARQLTIPGDGGPLYLGSLQVTLPTQPGVYRLDMLNAGSVGSDFGARLDFGFDPRTTWLANQGDFEGGTLDLIVDQSAECVSGTPCAGDGNDCTQDICEAGTCRHPPLATGAPCGNQTPQGNCDIGDVCDGAGACIPNYAPNTTICRAGVNECDAPDYCTGDSIDCPPNQFVSLGTQCADDGDPCTTDACDGGGVCAHTNNGLCGACCVAGGDCMNNVLPEQCPDAATRFHSGVDCAAISCGAIPTVSEWGLVVLTLCLLTGAKIVFVPSSKKTASS